MCTLEQFYIEYHDRLISFCARQLRKSQTNPDVQDAVAGTYERMARYWEKSKATTLREYYSWGARIAYRVMLDQMKKAGRLVYLDNNILANLATDEINPYTMSTALELLNPPKMIHTCMEYRAMGYTNKEIGQLLGLTEDQVKYQFKKIKPWINRRLGG